ncbi:GNAT family N-acetyltransferase [Mucilaginibacter sp. AK015]|uniref:GNAT family N-acetyltransferase n=1 Tax=Mucilaginibacter sp. AK015 TaxID=2723072 RepID=UPI001613AD4A|nr:GNAT family N-acetyltransferase [Mucilaginibacter sp. AK015]MBB5394158.1 ribosomal protein S18 acetylase RimI-like enzyme [Mucilaginibacter sp. AK015]
MAHILDNPIYNALKTGNKKLSADGARAVHFRRDVAPFAGMENNSSADFKALSAFDPQVSPLVIFTPVKLDIPKKFEVIHEFEMQQMVYKGGMPIATAPKPVTELNESHIPQMLELTELTKPGPFLERTIEFGNYTGIFEDGKLVSMAGQRLQPTPYIELSAVCTHPDYLGRGYAGMLLNEQVKKVLQVSGTPFLHVLASNKAAISVYERVGFETRSPMFGYVLNIRK